MSDCPTLPELLCVIDCDTVTLHPVGDPGESTGQRALCAGCHRTSPVMHDLVEDALVRLVDLGWTTARGGAWLCPLCTAPGRGRYAFCSAQPEDEANQPRVRR